MSDGPYIVSKGDNGFWVIGDCPQRGRAVFAVRNDKARALDDAELMNLAYAAGRASQPDPTIADLARRVEALEGREPNA